LGYAGEPKPLGNWLQNNKDTSAMKTPTLNELRQGYQEFQRREKRDAMYKTATFLVAHFWGKPAEMANSLGVLLFTWNQASYRYGSFDFDQLEKCIKKNFPLLEKYRAKNILSYSSNDDEDISQLFREFLIALQISDGNKAGTKSPVATAKALHLLAPAYFPLWDDKIARAYNCYYAYNPVGMYLNLRVFASRLPQHFTWRWMNKIQAKPFSN
jgi:hypothetical protein